MDLTARLGALTENENRVATQKVSEQMAAKINIRRQPRPSMPGFLENIIPRLAHLGRLLTI